MQTGTELWHAKDPNGAGTITWTETKRASATLQREHEQKSEKRSGAYNDESKSGAPERVGMLELRQAHDTSDDEWNGSHRHREHDADVMMSVVCCIKQLLPVMEVLEAAVKHANVTGKDR